MSSVAPETLNSKGHFKTQICVVFLSATLAVLKIQTMYSTANGLSKGGCVGVCLR